MQIQRTIASAYTVHTDVEKLFDPFLCILEMLMS